MLCWTQPSFDGLLTQLHLASAYSPSFTYAFDKSKASNPSVVKRLFRLFQLRRVPGGGGHSCSTSTCRGVSAIIFRYNSCGLPCLNLHSKLNKQGRKMYSLILLVGRLCQFSIQGKPQGKIYRKQIMYHIA